jgi:hypothetical protein
LPVYTKRTNKEKNTFAESVHSFDHFLLLEMSYDYEIVKFRKTAAENFVRTIVERCFQVLETSPFEIGLTGVSFHF